LQRINIFAKNHIMFAFWFWLFVLCFCFPLRARLKAQGGKNHFSAHAALSPQAVGYSSTNSASRTGAAPPSVRPPCCGAANNPRCPVASVVACTQAAHAVGHASSQSGGLRWQRAARRRRSLSLLPPTYVSCNLSPHISDHPRPFLQLRSCVLKRLGFTLWLLIYSLPSSSSPDFTRSGWILVLCSWLVIVFPYWTDTSMVLPILLTNCQIRM